MGGLLNGRTHAKEQNWKWQHRCVQICIYKKKNEDMNWDPEQLWEGFKSWWQGRKILKIEFINFPFL